MSEPIRETLVRFLSRSFSTAGFQRAVIGLSGGIDSAVACSLACEALGPRNVLGIYMPYRTSPPDAEGIVTRLADQLGCRNQAVSITQHINAYFSEYPGSTLQIANKCARERMAILYDVAARTRALVVGTSNKSEIILGYGTLYGDIACDVNPLATLYKADVVNLAADLGLPTEIITRPPSADLWEGQTDEQEIGYSYDAIDSFLREYERGGNLESFPAGMAESLTARILANTHKRTLPITLGDQST